MKDYRGVEVGPLKPIKRILKEWVSMLDDRSWGKSDGPWWYNERASLSYFAGAVWRCNGWALEEFTTSKKRRGKERYGRGDIIFGIGHNQFTAEAKQSWPSAGSKARNAKDFLLDALSDAREDCKQVPAYGARRLALVFASPYIPASEKDDAEDPVARWLHGVSTITGAAIAWVFPRNGRNLLGDDGNIYPGGLLLLRPLRLKTDEMS
jgi:hypothetical protein